LQSVTLRGFVLVTRARIHALTAVILFYCALGVFALNNIDFDIWTLFGFGVLGFVMRTFGFPVVPMILGVVLGRIAEDSLSRVVAISYDPIVFLSRPWSLFFIILAVMSMCFPLYQKHRGEKAWTNYFLPVFLLALSIPVIMMNGMVRPGLAIIMAVSGLTLAFLRTKNGSPMPVTTSQQD